MEDQLWADVDGYVNTLLIREDETLLDAIRASAQAGLPPIHVSPAQGKFLHLIARLQGAREVLEIGTLGGYSTIWLARALPPGGRLVTLEADPRHAEVARKNLERAQVSSSVDLRVGLAEDLLRALAAERRPPFDLVFIDADKAGIPEYFTWSLRMSRRGAAIIVDNVVRKGSVLDAASTDPGVLGVRRFNELLATERRVSATTVQTVGAKGYDGFTLAVVVGE
jgi:predicted O-methyltransferase YrrM